jgi:hypothetical protein
MVLLWLGIQPQTREDQERPGVALQRLLADDPSLVVKTGADGTVMIGAPSEDQLDGPSTSSCIVSTSTGNQEH